MPPAKTQMGKKSRPQCRQTGVADLFLRKARPSSPILPVSNLPSAKDCQKEGTNGGNCPLWAASIHRECGPIMPKQPPCETLRRPPAKIPLHGRPTGQQACPHPSLATSPRRPEPPVPPKKSHLRSPMHRLSEGTSHLKAPFGLLAATRPKA